MAQSSEVNQGKVAADLTRRHNSRILGICDVSKVGRWKCSPVCRVNRSIKCKILDSVGIKKYITEPGEKVLCHMLFGNLYKYVIYHTT